jgi:hypothetical protein
VAGSVSIARAATALTAAADFATSTSGAGFSSSGWRHVCLGVATNTWEGDVCSAEWRLAVVVREG